MKNELAALFVENASRSGAQCLVVDSRDGLQAAVDGLLDEQDAVFCPELTALERSIVIPASREAADVVSASAAVEEVAWGVAQTGTLVCAGATRRQLHTSLLPEHHIALLRASGIHETFLDLVKTFKELPRNITFITGPSRTADIEKTLVLGMHGPRRVTILVLLDA
ncbi:MAG: LutC/YkgG family protein [Desulfomonilaceae bacterium]